MESDLRLYTAVEMELGVRHCQLLPGPPDDPATVVITGEQLHKATGIASEACWARAAGGVGAGVAAPASLRSASRRRDGSRTIVRMQPSPSSPADTPKAIV